jgi:hypothetical protein
LGLAALTTNFKILWDCSIPVGFITISLLQKLTLPAPGGPVTSYPKLFIMPENIANVQATFLY